MATRTATQTFALLIGAAYILGGFAGFFSSLVQPPPINAPELMAQAGYGYLFGLFPINLLHNAVHLIVGVWGVAAYQSATGARTFARSIAVFYGLLALMGLFPWLQTTFGWIPLFGHDVWLHALTAAIAAYFGFQKSQKMSTIHQEPRVGANGKTVWEEPEAHP